MRTHKSIAKDLITNVYGASSSGDSFSVIHGDLVIEHFNKETKGTAGRFCSDYSTDIHAINKWIKTSHIHSKNMNNVEKKLNVFTSQVHKEITPGNKSLHFEHVRSLKAKLKKYNINIFGDRPAKNLTTGQEIEKEVTDCLLHAGEVGKKRFRAFSQDRLVEGKN